MDYLMTITRIHYYHNMAINIFQTLSIFITSTNAVYRFKYMEKIMRVYIENRQ